ncbi:hypothetical protein AOQ84DRAFT_8802 [Glonium stellatum]|uniref:Uncharacterized protein n=1 Tax=Glonium stellatum TaxID=574774 RepID=A0A8E2F456_9PEZI|nr:hypothetical protein AOQ84DRAFT_8802 [Glonium stellatum]
MDSSSTSPSSKPPRSLLSLPADIRIIIYSYALTWPNLSDAFALTQKAQGIALKDYEHLSSPLCTIPRTPVRTTTPAILLLNRQITAEALDVLYRTPLVIPKPPPYSHVASRYYDIFEFVPETQLQNAWRVELVLDAATDPEVALRWDGDRRFWRAWASCLASLLLETWIAKGNELRSLVIRLREPKGVGLGRHAQYPRNSVLLLLRYGISALGPMVKVEGARGEVLEYLTGRIGSGILE